jgi:hypothetical protein
LAITNKVKLFLWGTHKFFVDSKEGIITVVQNWKVGKTWNHILLIMDDKMKNDK